MNQARLIQLRKGCTAGVNRNAKGMLLSKRMSTRSYYEIIEIERTNPGLAAHLRKGRKVMKNIFSKRLKRISTEEGC